MPHSFLRLIGLAALVWTCCVPLARQPRHAAFQPVLAAAQATSPLIAVDHRTRHVFSCDDAAYSYSGSALRILDMADEVRGTLVATRTLSTGCAGIVIDDAGGHGFVFDGAGHIVRFDPATGRLIARLRGPAVSPVAFLHLGGRYLIPYNAGQAGNYPGNAVVLGVNGTSFVPDGKADGGVLALDPASGRVQEVTALDPRHDAVVAADPTTGYVFFDTGKYVEAMNTRTGRRVRLARADVLAVGVATDGAGGHVFVGRMREINHADGTGNIPLTVDVYDLASGRRRRTIQVDNDNGDNFYFSMAVDARRGMLAVVPFFGDDALYVVDWRKGKVRQRIDIPYGWPTVAVDPRGGRVYMAVIPTPDRDQVEPTAPGVFLSVDESSGDILSLRTIGQNPQAILIDGVAGRAFACSDGVTMMDARPYPGAFGAALPSDPSAPPNATGVRYFKRTRHALRGSFLRFWERYGGLTTFGYPLTEQFSDGARIVQVTQRFELVLDRGHVETAPLGRELRSFNPAAAPPDTPTRWYVRATQHILAGRFLLYWRTHHGAQLLGLPISDAFEEGNGDGTGRRYLLQWFEKGRLEYHPENAGTSYTMQLGLVGVDVLQAWGWLPSPPLPVVETS